MDYAIVVTGKPEEVAEEVGFTAWAGSDKQYSRDQIVIFDRIVSNLGDRYRWQNSTFTCPVSGTYLFYLNVVSKPGHSMIVHIIKENSALVLAVADGVSDVHNHGSALVIINCLANERVWPQMALSGNLDGNNRESHFTGYLLHRDP